MDARNAVRAYLDSIQDNYPFGVPEVKAPPKEALPPGGLLFVARKAKGEASRTLITDADDLLQAAVSKGLEIPLTSASYFEVDDAASVQALAAVVRKSPPHFIVLLGEEAALRVVGKRADFKFEEMLGAWTDYEKIPTLVTCAVKEIKDTPQMKKVFWGHLKALRERLRS